MTDSKKSILPDYINWDHLKRFKICAESKSFKEAAAKIGTSTTALSHQVDTLEIELGYKLFELVNSNRTLKLTDQGTHLLQMVSMAHLYLSGSKSLINDSIIQEEQKKIKIVTTPGIADTILGKVVHIFLTKYYHCQIEILTMGPSSKIQENEIMIRADIKNQKGIIKEELFKLSMNLYASQDYIERMGMPEKKEDLQFHKILAFEALYYGSSNWALLEAEGLYTEVPISSNSIDFLHDMCCQGHGILEIPDIYPRQPNLIQVLEHIKSPKYTIYLAFHKEILNKAGSSEFIKFIINYCQKIN